MDDLDWDDDEFEVKLPATAGEQLLKKQGEIDETQFEGEDEELEEEKKAAEKSQPKKKFTPKYLTEKTPIDEPLDDPVAEKLRQQRLVEEADFEAAKDLFGGGDISLEEFEPQSMKDYEQLAKMLALKYLRPHKESVHYATMLKELMRKALETSTANDVKEVESTLIVMRNDKQKAEKPASKGKKALKKAQLNAGGTKSAANNDLDDARYAMESVDDEYDFM